MAAISLGVGCTPPIKNPVSCPQDDHGLSYRDPITLSCVIHPSKDKQASFYIFQSLYEYAATASTSTRLLVEFRQSIPLDTLLSSLSTILSATSIRVSLDIPDSQAPQDFPEHAVHVPIDVQNNVPISREMVRAAFAQKAAEIGNASFVPVELSDRARVKSFSMNDTPKHLLDYWHQHATDTTVFFPKLPPTAWSVLKNPE